MRVGTLFRTTTEAMEVVRPYWATADFAHHQQHDDDDAHARLYDAAAFSPGAAAAEDDDSERQQHQKPAKEKEAFEPVPLASDQLEQDRLGRAEQIYECFGCAYFGDADTVLESEDIERLRAMARERYGCSNRIMLAERMAEYYAAFRQRVNAQLLPHERALPGWSAAQILDHLKGVGHHNDPVIVFNDMLTETREIRERLKGCLFERSLQTGHERPNKVAFDCFDKMSKLLSHLQKQDPTKMAFFDRGTRVNVANLSQGPLTTHTKPLSDLWK